MWPFSKSTDDDDDDDQQFTPGPGFYNVSQEQIPVELVASDASGDYWEKEDGTVINTNPVDNEGDD
jgi:hypothetical protein